ncbi:hypothetical protein C1645_761576 [Glomus cerebriforme]|uniref:Uncharacterized protein n=1 Tax=Glomus cerebriforme TaxID=658196 RepID=A0A397T7J2_9GLOM|nr:hypothetical protein C1645_761576 [Glomus cerebriforme]
MIINLKMDLSLLSLVISLIFISSIVGPNIILNPKNKLKNLIKISNIKVFKSKYTFKFKHWLDCSFCLVFDNLDFLLFLLIYNKNVGVNKMMRNK